MRELTFREMEEVNGGLAFIPIIMGIVAIDAACLTAWWAISMNGYQKER